MCGIAGYWNFRSERPADERLVRRMVRTMIHRGPDEEGFWLDGSLAIGMRRLKVVDPEGGHQPMGSEDGSVQVVFNGEIYNHMDLRRELAALGHTFRTRSDTEAIVHAFEQWGHECVKRFNGMFAFAAWDARRQHLLLARDRLGIKPLYVYEGPEGVIFGSELKAVIAAPWVPVEWDLEALDDFMTYEYVPTPRSIVRSVCKLPPACTVLYSRGAGATPRRERFWHLGRRPAPATSEQGEHDLRQHLRTSVRRRLMADVPLGAFLSGGVDSSIVVGLMSAESPGQVRSFSIGFADRSYDELPYARLVARRFGTTHREELVEAEIGALAAQLADYFDEPFADVSAFPTFLISSLARQEVTVALSGDGGDELFAGYDHYRADQWASRLGWLVKGSSWRWMDRLLERLPPSAQKKGMVNKAKRFAEGLRRPENLEHARWLVFWDLVQRRDICTGALLESLGDHDPFEFYRHLLAEADSMGFEGLQRQLYADVKGYLADDILVKLDRMSMAVSLEARVPYLDHEVVECAFGMPAEWKLKGGSTKRILKSSFRDLLPREIQRRGKEGFSMPMKNWLRGPLQPMLRELLSEQRLRTRGWFRPAVVEKLVSEHLEGRQNHAHRLWCLMSLELSLDGLERRVRERTSQAEKVPG